jgi:hypothetical protein
VLVLSTKSRLKEGITNAQADELHAFATNLIKLIQGNTEF